jgi:hypothetical protein
MAAHVALVSYGRQAGSQRRVRAEQLFEPGHFGGRQRLIEISK